MQDAYTCLVEALDSARRETAKALLREVFEQIFSQTRGFVQRLAQSNDALRDTPAPTLMRTFIGLIFAYFMRDWPSPPVGCAGWARSRSSSLGHFIS